ncbi:MAG: hypothetical protein EAZ43_01595 [Betaproteobacteria bacterium]|nr:MAG: hypothetical protein EAZ43_01595 [Betaproteobacteria bacterium]
MNPLHRHAVHAAFVCSALFVGLQSTAAVAQSSAAKEPLTVVYWSANDCRWCTWWEGTLIGSGGEAKFLKSPEGQSVRYTVVKKPRLSEPHAERDFSAEQRWLWPRVRDQVDGRIRGYPSFSLFQGDKLVVYAIGENEFASKLLPAIKEKLAAK